MHIVILAAGRGSRLGRDIPKPLTRLVTGETIMERQLSAFARVFPDTPVTIAVGHQVEHIVAAYPDLQKHYNARFAVTNTAKTLEGAAHGTPFDEGVLWVNGDLVFDDEVLNIMRRYVRTEHSAVAVSRGPVNDEEIKFTLDPDGFIDRLNKTIHPRFALGEGVGLNYISVHDKGEFLYWLNRVRDDDYFERAIELSASSGLRFEPADVTGHTAIEIDFADDLVRANLAVA